MAKGSSSFIFFIVLLALGAVVVLGMNHVQHGFFDSTRDKLDSGKNFIDTFVEKIKPANEKSNEKANEKKLPVKPEEKVTKPKTKIDPAKLDQHKDSLGRKDRVELEELLNKLN